MFKTAEELDITKQNYDALVLVLNLLEEGAIKHVNTDDLSSEEEYDAVKEFGWQGVIFNMNHWNDPVFNDGKMSFDEDAVKCGAVCCIAGSAEFFGKTSFKWVTEDHPIYKLFYPEDVLYYEHITDKQAAVALRGYLETGIVSWDHAIPDDPDDLD